MYDISIILSFYNRIDYLKLLLAGFEKQTYKNFEIIIADDGSSPESVKLLKGLISSSPLKIRHLWQDDMGFRKNRILNKAISESCSEYLIFIDGDCVPHEEFVFEHYANRREDCCLTGRRVNLSEKITRLLNEDKIRNNYLEKHFGMLVWDGIFGRSFDVEKGIYLKSSAFREYVNRKKRGVLGCNFSLYKKDILLINGFDERYEAPSVGEDTDIQYRLELNGISIQSLNNIAIQYHLYHKLQGRPEKNLILFREIQAGQKACTPYGIIKTNQ